MPNPNTETATTTISKVRISLLPSTKRTPVINCESCSFCFSCDFAAVGRRIKARAAMTAMKEMPLMVKHQPGPSQPYTNPPIAGPMTVPILKMELLRAMALVSASRSTISSTKDCLAGASKALAVPNRNASTSTCHG